ncbi:hypothetical protein SAMN05216474_0554 [Lishizhenia tianjinensis]|uniref:Low-complexity protein n=2 Tax=Lishizhenia tianjinensis TaxID=477690 RepID=A0A1I6XZ38_9FLAO|nr:hypothetical protein SAMN05216474_0554 [Lishizhenia tianjinensis]
MYVKYDTKLKKMKASKKNTTKLGLLAGGLALATLGSGAFAATSLGSAGELRSELAAETIQAGIDFKSQDAKCGEAKSTEAKCGEEGKATEAKCGEEGKATEAKCGEEGKATEAKCGEEGKATEAKCGEEGKATEAKCGEAGKK